MSLYVTSDLHGLPLADLKRLLNTVNFNDNDWLFTLGGVIDRQTDGGFEILKWLLEQPNAPIYETVSVGDKDFCLYTQALIISIKIKSSPTILSTSFLWAWPKITDEYFDDIITVLDNSHFKSTTKLSFL